MEVTPRHVPTIGFVNVETITFLSDVNVIPVSNRDPEALELETDIARIEGIITVFDLRLLLKF